MFLRLLLLRADKQEVEDGEHAQDHHQANNGVTTTTGRLRVGRRDKEVDYRFHETGYFLKAKPRDYTRAHTGGERSRRPITASASLSCRQPKAAVYRVGMPSGV